MPSFWPMTNKATLLTLIFLGYFTTETFAADCLILDIDSYHDFKTDKQDQLTQSFFVEITVVSDLPRKVALSALKGLALEAVRETGAHNVDIKQFPDLDTALTKGKSQDLTVRHTPDIERFSFAKTEWVVFDILGYDIGNAFTSDDLKQARPINKCVPL